MTWSVPFLQARPAETPAGAEADADDAWTRHVSMLATHGISEPGSALAVRRRKPATEADARRSTAWPRPSPICCPGWNT